MNRYFTAFKWVHDFSVFLGKQENKIFDYDYQKHDLNRQIAIKRQLQKKLVDEVKLFDVPKEARFFYKLSLKIRNMK